MTIRKVKEAMKYANKVCEEKISELDGSDELCTCPTCESLEHVSYTGAYRGRREFECSNPSNEDCGYFTTSTSLEAIETYRKVMVENLTTLLQANSVVDGIRELSETSKHFIELPLERFYEYIAEEASKSEITVEEGTDIVTVFCDLAGSGLAKNKAIILAMVDDAPVFNIVTTFNYLSTKQLIAAIEQRLETPESTQVVFVTDGDHSFVDPINEHFPEAIHIRQFHKKSSRGIIYAHLIYKGEEYTTRCLWDVVLSEGTPSDAVQRQRERRAKERTSGKQKANKTEYTELSKDIMVWKGKVYNPRGIRRKLPTEKSAKENDTKNDRGNTSPPDPEELIFKGELEDAKKLPVFSHCFEVMKEVFGGLHITTNVVENVFNVKSKLGEHRSMKFGERILVCLLYGHLELNDMSKEELSEFLKEEVIIHDFIRNKTLHGSGLQKDKPEEPPPTDTIKKAVKTGQQLAIHYCDRNRTHTSRAITPEKIEKNSYDGTTRIKAHCHLRDAHRTFRLDRIRDLSIFNPDPYCF
ncbi:hypothetical protein AKJ38_01870 [candidate division MSBL1 archaeon SCGC-AAA259I14]|uniref:WYL domain-containing protein n=1 Tax=candidate division MSBL1 archaeon SCGC-AAA259I14 TaxID=1698268 RepID=A0A133USL2_9EURY|nr:hypothetical protein AKJ38_01870 [candidate division MSBL1 archaeon SCGC-AAA259I14]